jgi:undecaprenyl-diphosphatase
VNYRLFETIHGWSGNDVIDAVMRFSARYLIFALFALLALLCVQALRRRRLARVVEVVVSLAVAFVLGRAAAALHPEARPFQTHHVHVLVAHAAGQSFPSDHATAAFAVALAVLVFLSRGWGIVLLLLAVLIGFARVYDGIHYPGDIGGSLLVAAIATGLVAASARLVARRVA